MCKEARLHRRPRSQDLIWQLRGILSRYLLVLIILTLP